jgi:hypothetical protein
MTDFLEHTALNAPHGASLVAAPPAPLASPATPTGSTVDRAGRATRSLRRDHGRAAAEAILHRSEWLGPADRQLLKSIFGDGHSVARLAPMLHTGKRSLRRRVKRLLDRLNSRRFAFVAVRHNHWTPTRRRVAAAMVLQGLSMREASESLRLSLHNVRRHYDAINALFDASERANDTAGERTRA